MIEHKGIRNYNTQEANHGNVEALSKLEIFSACMTKDYIHTNNPFKRVRPVITGK